MVVRVRLGTKKESGRLATEKQVDYLRTLAKQARVSHAKPFEECTLDEASKLIDELLEKVNANGKSVGKEKPRPRPVPARSVQKSDYAASARFGLAFKLVFADELRRDYWPPKQEQRESFVRRVCEVYELMNEAAQKAGLQ